MVHSSGNYIFITNNQHMYITLYNISLTVVYLDLVKDNIKNKKVCNFSLTLIQIQWLKTRTL